MQRVNTQIIADELWQAREMKRQCAPISDRFADFNLENAYEVSQINHNRKLKTGVWAIGKKIGLTSLAVQKQLGVHEPDFGFLTSEMEVRSEGILPAGSLFQGRVEGEVAFTLSKDLIQPEQDRFQESEIIAATEYVQGCIEIIDTRIADWKIKIQDTVADNASSAFFVLGKKKVKLHQIDLRLTGMCLILNEEIESTGAGAACLGHPVRAVCWLANKMFELKTPLKAGDIVLAGAFGPVVSFREGDQCEVHLNGLGRLVVNYESK